MAAGNRYGKQAVDDVQSIFTKRAVKLGDATAFKELSFTDFLHSMALITVSFCPLSAPRPCVVYLALVRCAVVRCCLLCPAPALWLPNLAHLVSRGTLLSGICAFAGGARQIARVESAGSSGHLVLTGAFAWL